MFVFVRGNMEPENFAVKDNLVGGFNPPEKY